MNQHHSKAVGWLCVLAVVAIGCSKDDLNNLANKAKNAVSEGSAQVKDTVGEQVDSAKNTIVGAKAEVEQQLNMAGSIKLNVGSKVQTTACYVHLLKQGSGRPTVLQFRSYRDAESESFPSIFLQAQVQAASAAELANQTVQCRLFVQLEEHGGVFFAEANTPVELRIISVEENLVKAVLGRASLLDTATGNMVTTTGQFEGVLQ